MNDQGGGPQAGPLDLPLPLARELGVGAVAPAAVHLGFVAEEHVVEQDHAGMEDSDAISKGSECSILPGCSALSVTESRCCRPRRTSSSTSFATWSPQSMTVDQVPDLLEHDLTCGWSCAARAARSPSPRGPGRASQSTSFFKKFDRTYGWSPSSFATWSWARQSSTSCFKT